MTTAVGWICATGSALLFGVTSALQHTAAGRASRRAPLDPGLLRDLLRDRLWLLGSACDVGAVALQAVALRAAPVLFVQPLLALGLPCAVLVRDLLQRRRPAWRDVVTCLASALSVAALVIITEPRGSAVVPTTAQLLAVAAILATIAVLPRLARRDRPTALLAAGSAGVALGLGAVLLRLVTSGWGSLPYGRLLLSIALLLAAGTLGLLATQSAFQYGPLAAPLALLTVVEPGSAAVGGRTILDEQLVLTGVRLPAACVAAALGIATVIILARRLEH